MMDALRPVDRSAVAVMSVFLTIATLLRIGGATLADARSTCPFNC